jgi:hypothetical protein
LKAHVPTLALSPTEALKVALCDNDASRVREILKQYPELRARIDDPLSDYSFDQRGLFAECSAAIGRRSMCCWAKNGPWSGGFGMLDDCDPSLVEFLTERGEVVRNRGLRWAIAAPNAMIFEERLVNCLRLAPRNRAVYG